jgi:hypothetical protein
MATLANSDAIAGTPSKTTRINGCFNTYHPRTYPLSTKQNHRKIKILVCPKCACHA